jgi:hypothetical protein
MVRISEHKLIFNSQSGTVQTATPFGVSWNIQNFLTQFPRAGALAKYRVGLDYFHFDNAVAGVDTINIRLIGFVQNKNRTFMGTQEYNSDIIASMGQHEGTTTFNVNPNPPKLVEGSFTSNGNITVQFIGQDGAPINWAPSTNSFQMNLDVIIEYDSE